MRPFILAAALGLLALTPAVHAADCTIDQVGKRYNAQIEITHSGGREWTFSGSGLHTNLEGSGTTLVIHGPWPVEVTLSGCDNMPDVADAINEMQRNYNQCLGITKQGTFTGQDRAIGCTGDAG